MTKGGKNKVSAEVVGCPTITFGQPSTAIILVLPATAGHTKMAGQLNTVKLNVVPIFAKGDATSSWKNKIAREENSQRILTDGPYFIYGHPLILKNMLAYFEFKEDDISLVPVWAILSSLPLECWHPNALGKIGTRLGTPLVMDSLTMKMERVLYARILIEVDASKKLMD
ncbi:UNVERIFIED_CONTAM: hypothetical protein Sradi_3954600 [Sesamum radiatum]|uniref:DUF4283 domain-containing protein n=1 Tax=Sesamum radiatum TaxID=300843 RepID=A0AAW2PJ22_SESRA